MSNNQGLNRSRQRKQLILLGLVTAVMALSVTQCLMIQNTKSQESRQRLIESERSRRLTEEKISLLANRAEQKDQQIQALNTALESAEKALKECQETRKKPKKKAAAPVVTGEFQLPKVDFDCAAEAAPPAAPAKPNKRKASSVRIGQNLFSANKVSQRYFVGEAALTDKISITADALSAGADDIRYGEQSVGLAYTFLGHHDQYGLASSIGLKAASQVISDKDGYGLRKDYIMPVMRARIDNEDIFSALSIGKSMSGDINVIQTNLAVGVRFVKKESYNLNVGFEYIERSMSQKESFNGGLITNNLFIGGEL